MSESTSASGVSTQTVGSIINLALKIAGVLGVGVTAQAEDTNDALALLNQMLGAWDTKRWDVYGLQDVSVTATGAQSYTIGAGSDFNVPRPDRIEAAYMRQKPANSGLPVDYSLELLSAYEDYARISVKTLTSFARYCFYDAAYPNGNIYFWPIPNQPEFELHVLVKLPLGQFNSVKNVFSLPPNYQEAVLYNLAARLRIMYQMPIDQAIVSLAKSSLNTIQNSNAQVPTLKLDKGLGRAGGMSFYNVWSDNN